MDTISMFKEAAKALQEDERYLQLAEARRKNDEDEELQAQIGEFNLTRLDLDNEMKKEERDEERVRQLNERINELYNAIMKSPGMWAYNEAKQNIRGLVSHIEAIVSAAVDGENPDDVQPPAQGCGEGGCASCSGCG